MQKTQREPIGDPSAHLPPARHNKVTSEFVEQFSPVILLLMGLEFVVVYDGLGFSNIISHGSGMACAFYLI